MALPKPPKENYTLEEVAAEYEWSEDDLWDYAELGKLEFCFLFKDTWATVLERWWVGDEDIGGKFLETNAIGLVKLDGPFPIHPDNVSYFREENRYCDPINSYSQTIKMFQATKFADSFSPPSSPEVIYEFALAKPGIFRLVITHEEKERFNSWIFSQSESTSQKNLHTVNQAEAQKKWRFKELVDFVELTKKEPLSEQDIADRFIKNFPGITRRIIGKILKHYNDDDKKILDVLNAKDAKKSEYYRNYGKKFYPYEKRKKRK